MPQSSCSTLFVLSRSPPKIKNGGETVTAEQSLRRPETEGHVTSEVAPRDRKRTLGEATARTLITGSLDGASVMTNVP